MNALVKKDIDQQSFGRSSIPIDSLRSLIPNKGYYLPLLRGEVHNQKEDSFEGAEVGRKGNKKQTSSTTFLPSYYIV